MKVREFLTLPSRDVSLEPIEFPVLAVIINSVVCRMKGLPFHRLSNEGAFMHRTSQPSAYSQVEMIVIFGNTLKDSLSNNFPQA
jgi:hypothetical protein